MTYEELIRMKMVETHKKALVTVDSEPESDVIKVRFVANATMIMDTHDDVHLPGSATWKEVMHLKDHNKTIDSEIGVITDIQLEDIPLADIGIDKAGSTECVVTYSDVHKYMCEKSFERYKTKRMNRHSVGMRYIDIELAYDHPDAGQAYGNWKAYADKIHNPESVKDGFFYVVKKYSFNEVSAILFASNKFTPTLEVKKSIREFGNSIKKTSIFARIGKKM